MLCFATHLKSMRDVRSYLLDDLRLDEHSLKDLDPAAISEITEATPTPNVVMQIPVKQVTPRVRNLRMEPFAGGAETRSALRRKYAGTASDSRFACYHKCKLR